MSVPPSNAVNALPPTQNLQGLAQEALGTLGGLPKEEEAVDDDQYDEGEEAARGRVPPRTTSASTFWEYYVTQVESDCSSKELKRVTKTNILP